MLEDEESFKYLDSTLYLPSFCFSWKFLSEQETEICLFVSLSIVIIGSDFPKLSFLFLNVQHYVSPRFDAERRKQQRLTSSVFTYCRSLTFCVRINFFLYQTNMFLLSQYVTMKFCIFHTHLLLGLVAKRAVYKHGCHYECLHAVAPSNQPLSYLKMIVTSEWQICRHVLYQLKPDCFSLSFVR